MFVLVQLFHSIMKKCVALHIRINLVFFAISTLFFLYWAGSSSRYNYIVIPFPRSWGFQQSSNSNSINSIEEYEKVFLYDHYSVSVYWQWRLHCSGWLILSHITIGIKSNIITIEIWLSLSWENGSGSRI